MWTIVIAVKQKSASCISLGCKIDSFYTQVGPVLTDLGN